MHKNIRKILRKLLNEVFDNLQIPKDLKEKKLSNEYVYTFKTKNHKYCLSFKNIAGNFQPVGLTKKENINNIILNSKDVYFISWGICDENNETNDNIKTSSNEEYYVFNSIFAIIKEFSTKKSFDVLVYQSFKKRKEIYNKMVEKTFKNLYHKEDGVMNTFLIKKELI